MASACNALFTDDEFEAALSNSMQHFRHISGLKREQKLCLETGTEAQCFRNSTNWFRKEPNFSIAAASTERLVETRPCLCFSCDAISFHNERPG